VKIINLTVQVESREALAALLEAGREHTLYECHVLNFRVLPTPATDLAPPTPAPVGSSGHTTRDYRNAPSNIGPLAFEWQDKPHRLVYDLCREIERQAATPAAATPAAKPAKSRRKSSRKAK
jgi:hypothetical protein